MSYRDEREALEPVIDMILSGIVGFNKAAERRIESDEWTHTHKLELNQLRKKLLDLQMELIELKKKTW